MKTLPIATFLAALCCTATTVFAEGPDELWEVTMKMEMPGMPAMPARTSQVCKGKGDRDPSKTVARDRDSDCKMVDSKQSGNKSTWKMVCTKPNAMTVVGDVTYNGDSYQGTMKMTGGDMDMTQTISGKKIGNCTYEDPAKRIDAVQAQSKAAIAKECDKQIESLQPLMIFGGANLPEESLYCKDRKADFCARSAKVAQQMRDLAGFSEASRKYPEWREAMKACGTDPATLSAPLCKAAVDKKDWPFVSENCPAEGRAVAQQNCTGMDYTAVLASPYKEVCQKYGADLAKKKVADDKAKSEPAAKPAAESKPSVGDTVKEGAKSLKKLLKF
ncbi:MAG: DUF3617 family protein [Betaproteobacteria bacterium]|nr:DUF3617 family protein [Betaproteobacteria bacterium]